MWLWLLLPVAAASGWWAARSDALRRGTRSDFNLSSHYFKGLNYLLNEQPDKAIEVFIRVLEVDNDTVETHLALGNLFRRRGETDRAIRIHQNLIARPTLSRAQRTQALLELGQDYMRAGLLDRAESLFQELLELDDHVVPALRQLVDIYQQEKDWDKAIATTQRLATSTGQRVNHVLAQYRCELAEQARADGDTARAVRMIEHALEEDTGCVRASLLQGELAMEAGDYAAAISAYRRVEQQDADYLSEVLEPLTACCNALGQREELIDYLQQAYARHGGITLMLTLAGLLRAQYGDAQAAEFITRQLHTLPSVRGLSQLIEIKLATSQGEMRDNLLLFQELAAPLLRDRPAYSCRHCGFTGKSLHWQCPGCKHWNTVKPIQGVEGE
ncbi:MAG: lipopolysaccharide assembly protein LapB [Gammaproteobacteria bacterium]|nr:lipopolysaccharide assembly protein LapB [Gammaproteobacteria bacterium]